MNMRSKSRIGISGARIEFPTARRRIAGLLAGALLALAGTAPAAEFYVAPDGNDGNPGTKEKPFATLERARDALRALSGAGRAGGATVWLRGGTYARDKCFELNERDSGAENARIVYRGAPGEEVRIMGGRTIPPAEVKPVSDPKFLERIVETNARGAVLQIDLKKLGVTYYGEIRPVGHCRPKYPPPLQIFVNGIELRLARWPNDKTLRVGNIVDPGGVPRPIPYDQMKAEHLRGGAFSYNFDRPNLWRDSDDIWVDGWFKWEWAPDRIRIASIDREKKVVRLAFAHLYGLASGGTPHATQYHFLNVPEELDAPGEYYLNRKSGVLYFAPPAPITPETVIEIASLAEPLVAMEGASFVTLRDVTLELTRGIGVYIERGASNIVGGCVIRNTGLHAVQMGVGIEPAATQVVDGYVGKPLPRQVGSLFEHMYWSSAYNRNAGTGHGIVGCDIAGGGISLSGGDRKTLTPGGNYVLNCRLKNCQVNVDGVGNRVAHCFISAGGGGAISYLGNDNVFEFNRITDAAKSDDTGALGTGRNPSARGNVIRCNFIHDVGTPSARWAGSHALHIDDGSGGDIIVSNVFLRAGNKGGGSHGVIDHNGGGGSVVENNIFAQCPKPLCGWRWDANRWNKYLNGSLIKKRLCEDVDITKPPYSTRYPELAGISKGPGPIKAGNNFVTSDLSQFENAKTLNFNLKKDAAVWKALPEFKPIPFGRIGLYRDEYRKTAPEN